MGHTTGNVRTSFENLEAAPTNDPTRWVTMRLSIRRSQALEYWSFVLDPAGVVRKFYEGMQSRNWDEASELLDPDVEIRYTATGEHFVGPAFLEMNRAYPEGWTIHVHEVLGVGDRVASQVRVDLGDEEFWCAGFYTVSDGRIVKGVEYWLTASSEPPPEWREAFTTPGNS